MESIFENQNNLSLAVTNYKKAVELAPKTTGLYHNVAIAKALDNKIREVIIICHKAINSNKYKF